MKYHLFTTFSIGSIPMAILKSAPRNLQSEIHLIRMSIWMSLQLNIGKFSTLTTLDEFLYVCAVISDAYARLIMKVRKIISF